MPNDLAEIKGRIEALNGPDRAIDVVIARIAGHEALLNLPENADQFIMAGSKLDRTIPAYTASLDASLALVERLLPGMSVEGRITPDARLEIYRPGHWMPLGVGERAGSAPLALLSALITALQNKESGDE